MEAGMIKIFNPRVPIIETETGTVRSIWKTKRWKRPGRPNARPKVRTRELRVYRSYTTPAGNFMHPVMANKLRAVLAARELLDGAIDSHTAQGGK